MSTELGRALTAVADAYPQIPPPDGGFFDRARRANRRKRIAAGLTAIVAVAAIGLTLRMTPPALQPAENPGMERIPNHFVDPPKWTADVRDAPIDRALVAFTAESTPELLTVIGSHDRYRTYPIPATGASEWSPTFLLSPDGRHLVTARDGKTELLEFATGRSRTLNEGAPLAWSPDGTRLALVDFTAAEIRVVALPSAEVLWRVPLTQTNRQLAVAFSPDGDSLAVQHGDFLGGYQKTTRLWSKSIGTYLQLAGPQAWTPDGRRIALIRPTKISIFDLFDAATGAQTDDYVPGGGFLGYVGEQGRSDGLPAIVAWQEGAPIVNAGNKALVRLMTPHDVLMTTADDTHELQMSATEIDWVATEAGEPDPGPALARYRPIVNAVVAVILALVALAVAIRLARRRRR